MDWSSLWWPAAVVAISIVAIFIFNEQLGNKIGQLKRFKWRNGEMEFFGGEIAKLESKAIKVGSDYNLPDKSHRTKTISQGELVSLAPRDIVLVSWGRMGQQLLDSATARGVAPEKSGSMVNILSNLRSVVTIPEEVNDLIIFLDRLGEDLAQKTSFIPAIDDAGVYADYVDLVMTWLHIYVVDSSGDENEPRVPRQRRETRVSNSFDEPNAEAPAALLLGLSGPFSGKQFAISQRQVKIGSESGNDLRITGDEFVSDYHAIVHFKNGSLLIEDSGSTNGTILNLNRLEPGYTHPLKIGDQIKLGESLLEVRSG